MGSGYGNDDILVERLSDFNSKLNQFFQFRSIS